LFLPQYLLKYSLHIHADIVKIGIVSDGQFGERAFEQIRKRFATEWILLPFPSSLVVDDIDLTIPPCDLYLSYLRHPEFGRPVFHVLLDGERIVWCQPIRRSPCGSTDAAAHELNGQVLDQEAMNRFALSICHNCRAPRFGKTCDKEKAGIIHLEELVSSLKGISPELWEKSMKALKRVPCTVASV